ncbi:helix-turn-helix domain-containing protein [Streptomyces sp. NPDC004051]
MRVRLLRFARDRAAAALHVARPAMSRRLRGLEERLGFALFERGGAGVVLAPRGPASCLVPPGSQEFFTPSRRPAGCACPVPRRVLAPRRRRGPRCGGGRGERTRDGRKTGWRHGFGGWLACWGGSSPRWAGAPAPR